MTELSQLSAGQWGRVLQVSRRPQDLFLDQHMRVVRDTTQMASLPPGLYWATINGITDALVFAGDPDANLPPRLGEETSLSETTEDSLAGIGLNWLDFLWADAEPIEAPRFPKVGTVISRSTGRDAGLMQRKLQGTAWSYQVRIDARPQWVSEDDLEPLPDVPDENDWVHEEPAEASVFAAMLTRAKLNRGVTDALFSYGVSKTKILPYQFKPVLKYLDTATDRMLIADEVGLGKTIEAGLLWMEMAARGQADRVMVVCPSALVEKWHAEMQTKFGFELEKYNSKDLSKLVERLEQGSQPSRFAAVVSLQTFRSFQDLDRLASLNFELDLCIVDEAHQMRNTETASHTLGIMLRDCSNAMILLSATPLNLGNRDLLSLMRILMPGEVETDADLTYRIDHHEPLQLLRKSAADPSTTNIQRRAYLQRIADSLMGAALVHRPAFKQLQDLLVGDNLTPAQVPALRDACAKLHGLSAVITRTKKSEVNESRTLRHAINKPVQWVAAEQEFYDAYYDWLRQIAVELQLPAGFALQMPLRLAGSCLPATARSVLDRDYVDVNGDGPNVASRSILAQEVPPRSLTQLAELVEGIDSKFDVLLEALQSEEMRGRQALLFTFSRKTLAYLQTKLSDKWRVATLHGGIAVEDRETIMRNFRAGEYDLVLATKVASEGLDFEFCSLVINYDLPWNPMEVEQRIGRIDRIGQQAEKILVLNFSTPGTIDTKIMERLLDRVGVFEHAIGELEPIIASSFELVQGIIMDFSLTKEERQRKIELATAAVEQNKSDSEILDTASAKLQAEDQFGIEAVEKRVAKGRYLGQLELANLVSDWARIRGGKTSLDSGKNQFKVMINDDMLQRLVTWRRDEGVTSAEISRVERSARNKSGIVVSLNAETARTDGGTLLNGHHPLVQIAAHDYSEHHTPHFAILRARSPHASQRGTFLVAIAAASWSGLRSTSELWTESINLDTGEVCSDTVSGLLFSALAEGSLSTDYGAAHPAAADVASDAMERLRHRRQHNEASRRIENEGLILERRDRAEQVRKSQRTSILNRMHKAPQMRHAFEGQLNKNEQRYNDAIVRIDSSAQTSLAMEELAIAQLEVF